MSSIKKMHTKENCFFFVCLTVQRSHNNVCKYYASDNVYYCWFLFVQRGAVLNSSALSSHPASSVSPKCRSKAHFQPETLWPHHRRAHQSSLAPRARANYIQGGDADVHVSYTAWIRTILLGVVIHMCRRHAAPTQAQVCLHWTAWRSDLSSVNCRRSCLSCCWSKGVEWPAKRCYVGLVAVGVQEQAEDILVPPLLRMTFPFPSHYHPSRTVVLASFYCLGHCKNVYDDDDDTDEFET